MEWLNATLHLKRPELGKLQLGNSPQSHMPVIYSESHIKKGIVSAEIFQFPNSKTRILLTCR